MSISRETALEIAHEVGLWLRQHDYEGLDPYQLDEKAFGARGFPLMRPLRRMLKPLHPLIPTGAFRRLAPVTIPKALGLVLGANASLQAAGDEQPFDEENRRLVERLAACRSHETESASWGVPYAWGSSPRYPPGYPMAIASAIIGLELLACFRATGIAEAFDLCSSTADYFLRTLHRWETQDKLCFHYSNLDRHRVPNVTAFVLAFLAEFGRETERDMSEVITKGLKYLFSIQRADGSWPYIEGSERVDGRHSGFVVQALKQISGIHPREELLDVVERGWAYYRRTFFDGPVPKWAPDRTYPVDIHDVAQAIITASVMGDIALARRVLEFVVATMYDGRGGFYYKLFSNGRANKTIFVRWNQAWMYRALAEFLLRSA